MTVSSTESRMVYDGDGVTVSRPFTFKILAESDLVITETTAAGVESTLLLTTDYTVSAGPWPTGGTVTLAVATASTVTMAITRVVPNDQETDYTEGGPFPAETHESALDKLTLLVQQVQDSADRALRFPTSEPISASAVLPSASVRASTTLGFDSNGDIDAPTALPAGTVGSGTAGNIPKYGTADTLDDTGLLPSQLAAGRKNLIINGDFQINQRVGSWSNVASGTGDQYTIDRWKVAFMGSSSGSFVNVKNTSVAEITIPRFKKSIEIECSGAEAAVAAGEIVAIQQHIEAQFCLHILAGDANAHPLTLSFWVKSPKSGLHCVSLRIPDGNISYVAEYTVTAPDTWQYIETTFPGNTTQDINNDNGIGLTLTFPLIAGTDWQAAAGAWAAGEDYASSSQQNLLDNTANEFFLTGVQLEIGSSASDFEHVLFGHELTLCQRYFEKSYELSDIPGAITEQCSVSGYSSGTNIFWPVRFRTEKRGTPSVTVSGTAGSPEVVREIVAAANRTASAEDIGTAGFSIESTAISADDLLVKGHWDADAELN